MTVLEPITRFLSDYKGRRVSLCQLIEGAERPRKPVLRVMDRLASDGYVEEVEDNKVKPGYREYGRAKRNPTWKIIKRPLWETFAPKAERYTNRDKMWKGVRALRRFSIAELMRITGVGEGSAASYIRLLMHHGFLRVIGKDGRKRVYLLIKDPGARRPSTPEIVREVHDGSA